MWLPHSFIVLLYAFSASGGLTNTTYDDSDSSFTFSGAWTAITPSDPCSSCATKPDTSQIHGGTWHDGNYRDGASSFTTGTFTFQGSAVYIFGIDQDSSEADIVFTLGDIQKTHHYTGTGSGSNQFAYNALFFSATGLPSDQTQTVSWVFSLDPTEVAAGKGEQIGLFDYAVVTTGEEDTPNPAPKSSTTSVQPIQTQDSNNNNDNNPTTNNNNNSPTTSMGSSNTVKTISTLEPSSSGASRSSTSSGASRSSGASQITNTASNVNQGSTVTISGASGTTTVIAGVAGASSKSKSNVGAIAGGVVGGLAVIALIALFIWYRLRRARREKPDTAVRPQSRFLRAADYPILARQAENAPQVSTSLSKAAMAGPSTISLLAPEDRSAEGQTTPSSENAPSILEPIVTENATTPNGTSSTTSRDIRWMEERLAALEAQVAAQQLQQPPPYIHEDDD
ncbi:hypothetical protein MSAN_01031400 [Mycena sanguinolenta]|uniref:Uncharacterized protein n=1 Tax=Mycena sanguinolenta TaxID=230812 RepID=A0A8H6YRZ0_9AGAR|nr:hypothetical protein MSAN_01031400 [Mycena sanguinolenta]